MCRLKGQNQVTSSSSSRKRGLNSQGPNSRGSYLGEKLGLTFDERAGTILRKNVENFAGGVKGSREITNSHEIRVEGENMKTWRGGRRDENHKVHE